ncbi:zinc finger HIT domain-containing protein 1 [Geosmithia morbida]|uniref:Zinc finger HIT domain-containing protein 1 n=1 Tax=Geosmithia morbida TaxID=1094350 RepID=A0A9P4YVT5_9HYPO|nr:zinc finger HIT domain-containing protein 1 [Geosmithia morbida]KAF4122636.1 zinc finger HIT domain-containing protein 1 [Geosmithia morbida]
MNNFGVVEIASLKTSLAPGWAYVPDTRAHPTGASQGSRKRARNAPAGPSIDDLTARQEVRIRKEVEALERDGNKDNTIPVVGHKSTAQGKTSAVRRILQSQKTFANHLDGFLAHQQAEATAAAAAAASANSRRAGGGHGKNPPPAAAPVPDRHGTPTADAPTATKAETSHDLGRSRPEPKGSLLADTYSTSRPEPDLAGKGLGEEDADLGEGGPLLVSRVPEVPSDKELGELLAHPPLTYLEARGSWDGNGKPPQRVFCEVCGYWGRVRCMKCGTRVCALDCLDTHREECVTRYGL